MSTTKDEVTVSLWGALASPQIVFLHFLSIFSQILHFFTLKIYKLALSELFFTY